MASVYVGDLPSDVTEKDLYQKFAQLGTVLSVKLCHDDECGKSPCYGYVLYQHPDNAEKAVEMFQNDVVQDQPISVLLADDSGLPLGDNAGQGSNMEGNVFVKNLDRTVDSNTLYKTFSTYGRVLSCKVPHRKKGSKCHGFVQFESEVDANSAISDMNGSVFFGKKLYVGHFLNREQREPTCDNQTTAGNAPSSLRTVYIKNLGPCVDSIFLKITCSPYGEISNVKIIRDTDGTSKGFAFVTFKKVEEAVKAIEMLNGMEIDGRVLFAGPAIKKSGRKHQNLKQHPQITCCEETVGALQENGNRTEVRFTCTHPANQLSDAYFDPARTNIMPAMSAQKQNNPQQYCNHSAESRSGEPNAGVQLPSLVSAQPEHIEADSIPTLPQIGKLKNAVAYRSLVRDALNQSSQNSKAQREPDHQVDSEQQLFEQQDLSQDSKFSTEQYPEGSIFLPDQYHQDSRLLSEQYSQESQSLPDSQQFYCEKQLQEIQTSLGQLQEMHPSTDMSSSTHGVNLYVKHLDDDVDDVTLKGMFSKFGDVISAKVMMEGEKSRGFGFVCFARAEDAARATRDMRRRVDDANRKPIYVAPAQRKEERQAFFREKLKCKQNEFHQLDVETVQKCLTILDKSKEVCVVAPLRGGGGGNRPCTTLPAEDKTKGALKNDGLESKLSSCLWGNQPCDSLRNVYHNNKFHGMLRSPNKHSNFYNFECFNVENLRTPLIKPTRLSNLADEIGQHSDLDSTWCPFNFSRDSEFTYGSATFLNSLNSILSPKLAGHARLGARKQAGSIWACGEDKDAKSAVADRDLKALGPIGFKPKTLDKVVCRDVGNKIRPSENLSLRARSYSKLAPMTPDTRKGPTVQSQYKETKPCLLENLFYFSTSQDNNAEDFIIKKFMPDPCTAVEHASIPPILKPTSHERNDEFSGCITQADFGFSQNDPGDFIGRDHFSVPDSERHPDVAADEVAGTSLRAASFSEEIVDRRVSAHRKERRDTACDSDDDDCWDMSRRRTVSINDPDSYHGFAEECFNFDSGEGPVDLSAMSGWPVEEQKLSLTVPLKAKVTHVLAEILSGPDEIDIWNNDLTQTIQELLRKKWKLGTISEKILNMLLEMDVGEILNLLQSKDDLIYVVSEGLKQIITFDQSADTRLFHSGNSLDINIGQPENTSAQDLEASNPMLGYE